MCVCVCVWNHIHRCGQQHPDACWIVLFNLASELKQNNNNKQKQYQQKNRLFFFLIITWITDYQSFCSYHLIEVSADPILLVKYIIASSTMSMLTIQLYLIGPTAVESTAISSFSLSLVFLTLLIRRNNNLQTFACPVNVFFSTGSESDRLRSVPVLFLGYKKEHISSHWCLG